jgi:hypothetical protein
VERQPGLGAANILSTHWLEWQSPTDVLVMKAPKATLKDQQFLESYLVKSSKFEYSNQYAEIW